MTEGSIPKKTLFDALPPAWPHSLLAQIRERNHDSGLRLVILDDDPTGGQTVHGVPVLTHWSPDLLASELNRSEAFFILANTRALQEGSAVERMREIGAAVNAAAQGTRHGVTIAIRGDSTLRGHFPAEVNVLAQPTAPDEPRLTCILVPYFAEGGRFTVGDVHYVQQGEQLVPTAQTEFARDRAFAYQNSYLPSWVEEKTSGRVRAGDVVSVSIDDLRLAGPAMVMAKLLAAPAGSVVIVNAAADRDLEVFVTGLQEAEATGRRFLYRTAASFVRVRAGIESWPLLTSSELHRQGTAGGLIVAGSYVARTSEQLASALALEGVQGVELGVEALLAGDEDTEVSRAAREVSRLLAAGHDAVLYTSRGLRTGDSPEESLAIGQRVSGAICGVVEKLTISPRFLVAKGGNTASEVATRGLGVRRAMVLGQILPGVPVWRLGEETRMPGLPYVIFPGNVGEADALAQAIRVLRGD